MIKKEVHTPILNFFTTFLNFFSSLISIIFSKKGKVNYFVVTLLLLVTQGFSQSCLRNFNMLNVSLYSGTAGTVGAVYRFPDASLGIDVHIRIDALNNATLDSMDLTGTGYLKAWQPQVKSLTGGGSIDWTVSFKKAGTNTDTIICAPISAIDIDGTTSLQEYVETAGHDTAYVGSPTELILSNPGSGWTLRALGPAKAYKDIDVTALKVQLQVEFRNVSSFIWRTGSTSAQSRLFSLYFNTFISCSSLTDGGTIGGNEFGCGTSFDPALVTNVSSPKGGNGGLEYRWLSNTVSSNPADVNWQIVPGAVSATYDPSTISTTTHYKREARRTSCAEWWESSNTVTKGLYAIPTAIITATENSCTPNDDRSVSGATVILTGGGGASYAWSNSLGNGASKSVNPATSTTYTVTATDANGCTATANKTITIISNPTATVSATESSCASNDNKVLSGASVSLTASGGTNYSWNNSLGTGASKTVTPSVTTTYVVTVSDANGCTATGSQTITIVSPSVITPTVTNVLCNGTFTGAISLSVSGGTTPYSYNWGGGITTKDRTGLAIGTYTVTVTDASGCAPTSSTIITEPTALSPSTSVTNILCNGMSTGAINLTVSGGTSPYTYNWGGGVTSEDRINLAAGSYTVTVTDANSCTQTSSSTVTQLTAINITTTPTPILCNGASTGAIAVTVTGGTSPYTYNWGGGVTTQNRIGVPAGTYNLTVTDANSCTQTTSVTLTQPAALSLNTGITHVICSGNTGAINLTVTGGTTPYNYNWGGGVTTEDRSGLPGGTYSVTVTDGNSCTATTSPTVNQTTGASLSTSITPVSCFGSNTGAINLTASGGSPFTYNWGGGFITEDRVNVVAGTYSVTVTNAQGCTSSTTAVVTTPSVLALTTNTTHVSCTGGSTGAIDITATGGMAPYTYNWGGGITTEDRTGLAIGNYSVTVTDANSCTATLSITITQPTVLNLSTSVTQVTCLGGSDGAIDLTVTGGVSPYTYNWGGGITTQDRTGLSAGVYSVTVTDANGCTAITGATLTPQNGAPNPPTGLRH